MIHLVADMNGRPLASFIMGVMPSDVDVLGPRGELIADWVKRGCPALRGMKDVDGFFDVPATVPASDPLWGLAFLDALEEYGWEVSESRFAWEEALHPRDDIGKFIESGAGMTMKKAPPASKDQIATAVEMKKAGKSYKEIQEVTGLNPKQAANIIFKVNKIEKAILAAGGTVPEPVAVEKVSDYNPLGLKLDPSLPQGWQKDPSGNLYDPKNPDKIAYVWGEKTKENSPYAKEGAGLGKYAYFKDGVQVSGAFATKEDYAAGAASINQGIGPASAAPSAAPSSSSPSYYAPIPIEKGAGLPGPWPISDDIERQLGSTYNTTMSKVGNTWAAELTYAERDAITGYTASGYVEINKTMRAGLSSAQGTKIMKAIDKAPIPPPPELVWRGMTSGNLVAGFEAGDVVTLNGITSGSIRPSMAQGWSNGKTIFEIKPTKGAFIRSISSHQSEDEYLMPHGKKYTVRGFAYVKFQNISKKIRVIQLEMQ